MIETKGLTKSYKMGTMTVDALRDVSVSVGKGEFVGIMGASGSGKSTLLHLLGLLDSPTSGKITIDGAEVNQMSDYQRSRFRLKRLGYVFQDYALMSELTVMENVYLTSLYKGVKKEQYISDTKSLLDTLGLSDRMHHLHSELSGGQQQRVSIARAIVHKPDILFADEPCANLDSRSSGNVLELFKQVNVEQNQTIVMVSHEEWHTEYMDRVITLADGAIESDRYQ